MLQGPLNVTNDVIAVSAVTSPFWLPSLETISYEAALLLPIAGLVWLLIQITVFAVRRIRNQK